MELLGVAAVLLESDGRVDLWSPQAEELLGYTAEEAVGQYAAPQVLTHLDKITRGLDPYIATCVYALYDARRAECHLATAGHLPPVLVRGEGTPELLDLSTGTPLGVGGVPFESTTITLGPGDRLVLYTDGLVETREDPIDERLEVLLTLLGSPDPSVEETCDRLLRELRTADDHDDVALLIARADPRRPWGRL